MSIEMRGPHTCGSVSSSTSRSLQSGAAGRATDRAQQRRDRGSAIDRVSTSERPRAHEPTLLSPGPSACGRPGQLTDGQLEGRARAGGHDRRLDAQNDEGESDDFEELEGLEHLEGFVVALRQEALAFARHLEQLAA